MSNDKVFDELTKGFWAINFDLDTKLAEDLHPSHTHQGAYAELKNFFTEKGFAHRQHSGYVSKGMYSTVEMKVIILDLGVRYPYANDYIKRMDATLVIPEYIFDCKEILDETAEETVEYTGEVENFIPQPKVQENKEIDQMQNETVIPQELKSGVLERKVEIHVKPLENTTGENKKEVVKKTPKIKI